MKYLILSLLLAGCLPVKQVGSNANATLTYLDFTYSGIVRTREWTSEDGRMSQQNVVEGNSTAIDLWPAPGVHPIIDSLTEITLHRTRWDEPTMERFNISAMATLDGAAYRFGVEASDGGIRRDIIFCFETADNGGPGFCPFRITQHGVYVCEQDNSCKKL
jgi:hypothetical protein